MTPSIFQPRLKLEYLGQKVIPGDQLPILGNFVTPLHISGRAEARKMKFGTQNDREVPYLKKSAQVGRHMANENIGRKVKLETLNLVRRMFTRCPIVRN